MLARIPFQKNVHNSQLTTFAVLFQEFLDATRCVNQLLFSGKKRMTI